MKNKFFGIDVKISPDNKPYLIEINGEDSGTDGFDRVYEDSRVDRDICDRIKEIVGDGLVNVKELTTFSNRFEPLSSYLEEIGLQFKLTRYLTEFEGVKLKLFIGFGNYYYGVERINPDLLMNTRIIQKITWDKSSQYDLLSESGIVDSIPKSAFYNAMPESISELETLLNNSSANIFVNKIIDRCGGEDVILLTRDEFEKEVIRIKKDWVKDLDKKIKDKWTPRLIQEFIESKPIYNKTTGKYYDGCARIIWLNGFVDAYWRLAKDPIDKRFSSLENKFKVNFGNSKRAVEVNDADKIILKEFSEKVIKELELKI